MRAVEITGHGGNAVVSLAERHEPVRKAGEVRIAMRAGGLNQVDLYMRNSGAGITHTLPLVMGLDGAGEILDADDDETTLRPGQPVVIHPGLFCGRCSYCRRGETVLCTEMRFMGEHVDGTLADIVSVPRQNVFPAPQGLDLVEAAALGVAPLTAWRMVFTKAQLKPWETVLIFGIGGSVSLAAMQLAHMIGARTIVTSRSTEKLTKAQTLGASETINGASSDIAKSVLAMTDGQGVDVVIENVGEAVWPHAMKALRRGGRIVTCGATSGDSPSADLRRLFIRQLQVFGSTHGTLDEFAALLAMSARGQFRPVLDSRFPLEGIHEALNRLEAGSQFGKIGIEF